MPHLFERGASEADTRVNEAVLSEMVVAVHCTCAKWFCRRSPKAFLVTFAVTGKSNCQPRHERQTKTFLLLCKSSLSLRISGKLKTFNRFCKSSFNPRHERQTKTFLLLSKSSLNINHERQAKSYHSFVSNQLKLIP